MRIQKFEANIKAKLYVDFKFMELGLKKVPDKKAWKKAFYDYFRDSRYGYETDYIVENKKYILKGFTSRKMRLVKRGHAADWVNDDRTNPTLVSVIKNELDKLPAFFTHYRKLGIKRFVIIDNASSDGTMEFLMKQRDVELYTVKEKFRGSLKEGWINRILALYGFNRWYLVVDADELLVWPQLEKKTLSEMVMIFQKHRYYRPLAIMLDMYSEGVLYQGSSDDVLQKFCFLDKDTYYQIENDLVDILSGGPRKRVLGSEVWLSKTPLFFLKPGDILCQAHYMYPYKKHKRLRCPLALLHYKFAYRASYKEMKEYVRNGIDSNRIFESKACLNRNMKFYYENSLYLDHTWKICEIPYIVDIFGVFKEGNK